MFSTDDTNDRDIFANRPSDVWGITPGGVHGDPPTDIWDNPLDVGDGGGVVDTILDLFGGLFGG